MKLTWAKVGGRKTVIGVMMMAAGIAMELWGPKGLTETMSHYLMMLGIGYFGANIAVKGTHVFQAAKAQPAPVDNSEVMKKLEAIEAAQIEAAQGASESADVETVKKQNALMMESMTNVNKGVAEIVAFIRQS